MTNSVCSVDGCASPISCRRMCAAHHKRWLRYGDPTMGRARAGATKALVRPPEYEVWRAMKRRCLNQNSKDFNAYGGAGITICDRWRASVRAFIADMGSRPPGTSIDRFPNKSGNYEPGNCRWATPTEQARNARSNVLLTIAGETACASEFAQRAGLNPSCVIRRIHVATRKGAPIADDALRNGRRGRPSVMTTIDGESKSFAEWCRYFGIARGVAHRRVKNGMSAVDALRMPVAKRKKGPNRADEAGPG